MDNCQHCPEHNRATDPDYKHIPWANIAGAFINLWGGFFIAFTVLGRRLLQRYTLTIPGYTYINVKTE